MSYKHISPEERYYIEKSLKKGSLIDDIAITLNRHKSTIFREIKRNTGGRGYRHNQANNKAKHRHQCKAKNIKMTSGMTPIIEGFLSLQWSPEQVAGYLKNEGFPSIHHETIYQHILKDKKSGGQLYKHLRHQGKKYRKRYGNSHNTSGIVDRVGIEERPEIVNKRERVGDWEGDTIIGKNHKGAIVTLDERVSKLRFALPTRGKKAQAVKEAIVQLLSPIRQQIKTITFDNGKEFSHHKQIAKQLKCNVYFARPYHSWERGQNENANGLLRQYFPKSMELLDVTKKQVIEAVDKLNSRPRKCLGFKTPYQVFYELTGITRKIILRSVALIT